MVDHSEEHLEFTQEQNRAAQLHGGISRALDKSPVKTSADVPRVEVVNHVIEEILKTHELHVSDRGWVVAKTKSGEPADLAKLVEEQLLLSKYVDAQSVTAAIKAGQLNIGCKEDLRTTRDKVEFVEKYGEEAFAKLPLKRQAALPSDPREMNAEQYKTLTVSQKSTLVSQGLTPDDIYAILGRK
jgi:hypothetical protein